MKTARILLIGLVLVVLVPAASFSDNGGMEGTVWESNFPPGQWLVTEEKLPLDVKKIPD